MNKAGHQAVRSKRAGFLFDRAGFILFAQGADVHSELDDAQQRLESSYRHSRTAPERGLIIKSAGAALGARSWINAQIFRFGKTFPDRSFSCASLKLSRPAPCFRPDVAVRDKRVKVASGRSISAMMIFFALLSCWRTATSSRNRSSREAVASARRSINSCEPAECSWRFAGSTVFQICRARLSLPPARVEFQRRACENLACRSQMLFARAPAAFSRIVLPIR